MSKIHEVLKVLPIDVKKASISFASGDLLCENSIFGQIKVPEDAFIHLIWYVFKYFMKQKFENKTNTITEWENFVFSNPLFTIRNKCGRLWEKKYATNI